MTDQFIHDALDQKMIVNRSLTLEIRHVGMVSDLVQRGLGKNFSEVIRTAIDYFYQHCNEENPQT